MAWRPAAGLAAAALLALAACAPAPIVSTPAPGGSLGAPSGPPSAARSSGSLVPSSAPIATAPSGTASVAPDGPLASAGSVVVLGNDHSLSLVSHDGRSTSLAPIDEGRFTFPAWSPDGTRIAAIRYGTGTNAVVVFDPRAVPSDEMAEPVVIFESDTIAPFYLSWTPDGERVSFLATDPDDSLALRLAPADGSAPLDGSGPGATIRTGNPFYYDWIDDARLLAHVGVGDDALLAEIGLDGDPTEPAVASPGVFRSAVVSPDRTFIGYVRVGGEESEVVVAARDGSSEHTIPVFGTAALSFDPTSARIATIGGVEGVASPPTIPVGPLRLLDAESGVDRVLLDGLVLGFWWSPDGRTIAALRLQPVGPEASTGRFVAAADPQEFRLLFVAADSGEITWQVAVEPGELFVEQLLPFFDQYALSHELWAPDSSAFLLPIVDVDGATRVAVMYRTGDPPRMLEGAAGFWSP